MKNVSISYSYYLEVVGTYVTFSQMFVQNFHILTLKVNYSGTLPYGHPVNVTRFILVRKLAQSSFSHLKNPFKMTTLLIRPDFCGLLETD